MNSVHAIARIDADGTIHLNAPGFASPGEHRVLLVLEDGDSMEAAVMSEAAFSKIWDNPVDSVYDSL